MGQKPKFGPLYQRVGQSAFLKTKMAVHRPNPCLSIPFLKIVFLCRKSFKLIIAINGNLKANSKYNVKRCRNSGGPSTRDSICTFAECRT